MIKAKDIDTSYMHVGLAEELPMIERKIRKLVAQCIEGFLENSISLALERSQGRDVVRVYIDMGKGDKLVYQTLLTDLKEQQND